MDTEKTPKNLQPRRRRGSVLWRGLNRGTARFYAILSHSALGRILSGYRRMNGKLTGQDSFSGPYRCKPASPARLQVARVVESGRLLRGGHALFSALLDCPIACYGLFGLLYGLLGLIAYFVGPRLSEQITRQFSGLVLAILALILSLPLLTTKKSLAESLGRSHFCRRLFVGFLGVPQDRFSYPERPFTLPAIRVACTLAGLLGIGAGICTLFVSPWVVPAVIGAIILLGMVFTYPETGVVLATLTLPLVWLDQKTLIASAALILLTWCSYGVKLVLLHRSIRFNLLDRVVLIFCLLIFITGFTGYGVTASSIWQSVSLAISASSYFLIVNLMNTRDYVRRCLVGVAASVVVVTVLAYIRHVPLDSLLWLEGSRAGDAIINGSINAVERLSQLWVDHSELYLVLVFSWIYAYLVHTKRLFRKVMGGVFILLELFLIFMTDSVSALFCIAAVTVLFLLMSGHKWLSAGLIALPPVVCVAYWAQYLIPISDNLQTILSRSRLYKSQLTESLWKMVWDHPAGIGVGDEAFAAVYPAYAAPDLGAVSDCGNLFFEILLGYGWPGLILVLAILFLFIQKSLTCLRYTVVSKDRAMILGGVTSLVGMVIFGSVRSFITSPRVFFTVALVVALCSTYENIVFEERDRERVEWAGSEDAENRFYRSGEFKRTRTNTSASQKE